MKNDYVAAARAFIKQFADELDTIWNNGKWFREYTAFAREHNIAYANGMSRFVLIKDNFVIKIDYNHSDYYGTSFSEYKVYKKAQKEGFDYLLCPISKIKCGHHYYYVMPRIDYLASEEDDDLELEECFDIDAVHWLHDNVYDIHDENFGCYNGDWVVIDYAWERQ